MPSARSSRTLGDLPSVQSEDPLASEVSIAVAADEHVSAMDWTAQLKELCCPSNR